MSLEVQIRKKLNSGRMLDVHFQGDGRIAVLGSSDSGKSVLLQCIAGTLKPEEGRIVLEGRVLFDSIRHVRLRPRERGIGVLGTDVNLISNRTVNENVQMALRSAGRRRKAADRRNGAPVTGKALLQAADSCLHDFHLDGLGGCYPAELSAVQKIRAGAARMVAADPALVLLDDPFQRLDSYEKARVLVEVRDLLDERGIPVLFATRDRNEAFAMGQQVLALQDGRSEPLEAKQVFFTRPSTISAALLAGVCNVTNVKRLNDTHLVSQAWGMIFCLEQKEPAAEVKDAEEAAPAEAHDAADEGSAAVPKGNTEDVAAAGEAETARERRERLREDLERSLRFELLPTDADRSTGQRTAVPAASRWQRLPADAAAVGVRPDAFLTERPAGAAVIFRIHDRRIEEDAGHWLVYFRTFPADRKSGGLRKNAGAGQSGETQELLWEIPKSLGSRQLAENCRVLYLPADQLLLLKKG